MRVLIPTGSFPPEVGGPASYVPRVATALSERGHHVDVATLSPRRGHPDEDYPFRVHRLGGRPGRMQRWGRVFRALGALLRESDLAFVNGLLMETALTNLVVRRPMVTKVVGDIVWERARDKGWITDDFETFQQTRYDWRIELRRTVRDWALRQSRAVIVPSEYLKRVVVGWGVPAGRIHVIYNALEPAGGKITPAEIPLATQHRIVTVCRLVSWKGVDELIDVVASLSDVGLAIVGDGPERADLVQRAERLGVTDRVYFAGQVPRETVPAYLRACDLFVLNSRYEGLPHAVLEALAAGLPVVATAVGGTPEVVRDGVNGRLVPAGNREELSAAIQSCLHEVRVREVGLAERFTSTRMLDETIAVLEGAGGAGR